MTEDSEGHIPEEETEDDEVVPGQIQAAIAKLKEQLKEATELSPQNPSQTGNTQPNTPKIELNEYGEIKSPDKKRS